MAPGGSAASMIRQMDALFYRRSFLIVTIVGLGFALYRIMQPFWGALPWAICLAFLLQPLQQRLTRRLRGRAGAAAGIVTALTPFVIFAPLLALGIAFADQARILLLRLQSIAMTLDRDELLRQVERYPLVGNVNRWLRDTLGIGSEQIYAWAVGAAQQLLGNLAATGGNLVLGAVGTAVSFVLMLFLLFFMLRDGPAMLQRLLHLVPAAETRRREILELLGNTTRGVVYGSGLTALVQGALTGVGFAIAGLPSPIVFAVLATLLSLLPAGGAALVWAPAALALLLMGSPGYALFMLVWGIVISASDNFLRPMFVSQHAPVSTLAVFVGVVGGVSAFGGIGLIAGPVLLTLVTTLLGFVDDKVLGESR